MKFPFLKMHGLGNDFVIIDQRLTEFPLDAEEIKLIAHRKLGIGCDQVIIIKSHPLYDCMVEIFNQDGSSAEACGNAARCVALLIQKKSSTILMGGHPLAAKITNHDEVAVDMGKPEFAWDKIPLSQEHAPPLIHFKAPGFEVGVAVNIGNPHVIFFTDDISGLTLQSLGPTFEHDSRFPNRVNVSFAQIINKGYVKLRVWERGAGETEACGTAACATFAAARKLELIESKATISLPGGNLSCMENADGSIKMIGPAKLAFTGIWR